MLGVFLRSRGEVVCVVDITQKGWWGALGCSGLSLTHIIRWPFFLAVHSSPKKCHRTFLACPSVHAACSRGCPQCDLTRLKRLQLDSSNQEQSKCFPISQRSERHTKCYVAVKYAFVMHPRTDIATFDDLWHTTPQDGVQDEDDQAN